MSIIFTADFSTRETLLRDFVIDAADQSRASLVMSDRTGRNALKLTTLPGDVSPLPGSGTMERCDAAMVHPNSEAPVALAGCIVEFWHDVMLPVGEFVLPQGRAHVLADLHGIRAAKAANWHLNFVNYNNPDATKWGLLQLQRFSGDPMSPTEHAVVLGESRLGKWYCFRHRAKLSAGEDGFFRTWMNGRLVMDHYGPTIYPSDAVYLKLANYHLPSDPAAQCSVIHDRVGLKVLG